MAGIGASEEEVDQAPIVAQIAVVIRTAAEGFKANGWRARA